MALLPPLFQTSRSLVRSGESGEERIRNVVLSLAHFARKPCILGGLFLGILLLVGCDASVQPFSSSDKYRYSIYGALNPAQDTQWVRVEPLQEPTSEGVSDEPLDATVTLENVDTGQTWVLRDSLTEVFRDELQHNFWTTAPIAPDTPYRVVVQNAEGETTSASTTTPVRPPSVEVKSALRLPCTPPQESNRFGIVLTEVDKLAALRMRYYQSPFGPTEVFEFDHFDAVTKGEARYEGSINYAEDLQSIRQTPGRSCLADSAKVIVASGGPDWPEFSRYSGATISELARPDSFTNVDGGHGTVAGVYTDTVGVRIERNAQR